MRRPGLAHASALLLLAAAFLPLAACSSGTPAPPAARSVLDATGATVSLPTEPARVVSLVPAVTESVFDLGADALLVGVTEYCLFPEGARSKERIGGLLNPSVERIVALRPDLVLASMENNRAQDVEALRRLGIPVYVFGYDETADAIRENCRTLGRVLGIEDRAESAIAAFDGRRAALRRLATGGARRRVFCQLGIEPLVSIGRASYLNDLVSDAGGENVTKDLEAYYPRVSREEVARRNPDVIVAVTMGEAAREVEAMWKPCASVEAVRHSRIHVVDPHTLCTPTLGMYVAALERLAPLIGGSDTVSTGDPANGAGTGTATRPR